MSDCSTVLHLVVGQIYWEEWLMVSNHTMRLVGCWHEISAYPNENWVQPYISSVSGRCTEWNANVPVSSPNHGKLNTKDKSPGVNRMGWLKCSVDATVLKFYPFPNSESYFRIVKLDSTYDTGWLKSFIDTCCDNMSATCTVFDHNSNFSSMNRIQIVCSK